jgi:superfamily II DNA or RNA helicase
MMHIMILNIMSNREKVQQEALEKTLSHKRCGLGISMGVGKTRIAIQHFQKNYNSFIRALVVIPKLSVKDAWLNELEKMELTALESHFTFTTYLSLNKQDPKEYDIVYLDECHSLLESHQEFLDQFNGKILGLTGTPPARKSSVKYRMVNKYCPIIFEFSVDEATDSNILNDYKIIIHQLELSKIKDLAKKSKNGGVWYTSEALDYGYLTNRCRDALSAKQQQMAAIMRMRGLMEYKTKEEYLKGMLNNISSKCIIFANTQAQADRMCKHSYHSGNSKSEENLELFSDGRIDKLSCVLQLSEGISIPNLRQGIIMHAYGNNRKSAQRIGRLLRLSPDQQAVCHILCYKGTQDEKWVEDALKTFDQSKIQYFNPLK